MTSRAPLRAALKKAWHSTINDAYVNGQINSERGLQVYFCNYLINSFKERNAPLTRRIFIEPRVKAPDSFVVPDILICNSQRVIGVVELKYKPRAAAHLVKDMQTLKAFGAQGCKIEIRNERYQGPSLEQPVFTIAKNAILCWAAVYSSEKKLELPSWFDESPRFLGLHALTRRGEDPKIVPRAKS